VHVATCRVEQEPLVTVCVGEIWSHVGTVGLRWAIWHGAAMFGFRLQIVLRWLCPAVEGLRQLTSSHADGAKLAGLGCAHGHVLPI
jgi:hypothetical protein